MNQMFIFISYFFKNIHKNILYIPSTVSSAEALVVPMRTTKPPSSLSSQFLTTRTLFLPSEIILYLSSDWSSLSPLSHFTSYVSLETEHTNCACSPSTTSWFWGLAMNSAASSKVEKNSYTIRSVTSMEQVYINKVWSTWWEVKFHGQDNLTINP